MINLTLNNLINKLKNDIKSLNHNYSGLTIVNLSINNEVKQFKNKKYYINVSALNYNYSQTITLVVSDIVFSNAINDGNIIKKNIKVDIIIDFIDLSYSSNINIYVKKIIESGISDSELKKRKLHEYCIKNKYYDKPKLPLNDYITKIAIITTKNSTISTDILNIINLKNIDNFYVDNNPIEIAIKINELQNNYYDIITLYRGGREDTAMMIYSETVVLDAIINSNVPIGVALGHEIDKPFVYNIADITFSTPTQFAESINNINKDYFNEFNNKLINIHKNFDFYINNFYKILKKDNLILLNNKIDKYIENFNNKLINVELNLNNKIDKEILKIKNRKQKTFIIMLLISIIGIVISYFIF